jgi:transposase-like protein
MTMLIELDAETEARVTAAARRHGLAPEQYAVGLLRNHLSSLGSSTGKLAPGDIAEITQVLTQGAENLPVLPPEVNDRASYYEDRL